MASRVEEIQAAHWTWPGGFKLIDVRGWTTLLSFSSSLRTLKGTADAVLVPHATLESASAVLQLRLVVDWSVVWDVFSDAT